MQNQIQLSEPYRRFAIILGLFFSKRFTFGIFHENELVFLLVSLSLSVKTYRSSVKYYFLCKEPLSDNSIYSHCQATLVAALEILL